MSTKEILQRSFLNTFGVAIYVSVVATVMTNGEHVFGRMPGVVAPFAILMLLVLSATVTGTLVFGKPVLLYVEGDKKSAVSMVLYTMMWLAVFTFLTFTAIALLK